MKLFEKLRQLGEWEDQQVYLVDAIENFYRHNGWKDETDQFFKQTSIQVVRIPPWQINQRLEVAAGQIQQRYALTDEQKQWLKERIFREALMVTTRHFATISSQADDMIRVRQAGKPFTPQQVAQWVRNNRPVRSEWDRAMMTVAEELGQVVPDNKKQLFQRDFAHVSKRTAQLRQMHADWEQGRWSPEDWGLENDPMHASQIRPNNAQVPALASQPASVLPGEISTWAQYVRDFIRRFDLDRSQRVTAWSILEELEERARRIEQSRPARKPAQAQSAPTTAPHAPRPRTTKTPLAPDPIAAVFEELKVRLDLLPTNAQRAHNAAASKKNEK